MRQLLVVAAILLGSSGSALAAEPSTVSPLDSPTLIAGEHADDRLWEVTDAGDVNGDGRGDLLVSHAVLLGASLPSSARSYVVFGDGTDAPVDLAALGARGFAIDGSAMAPWSTGVAGGGDVNDDGLDDVIVSELFGTVGGIENAGRVFVVFGKADAAPVDAEQLEADETGYEISGATPGGFAGFGGVIRDLDGDGKDEVLVAEKGRATIVFGKDDSSPVSLADIGDGGYRITGAGTPAIGGSVAAVGDVNGDGREDVALAGSCGLAGCAQNSAWIVFGKATTDPVDVAALGAGGYVLGGLAETAGVRAAGDVNGDGRADMLFDGDGETSVVFGRASTAPGTLPDTGYRIEHSGYGRAVGDVDGDGLDDVGVTGAGVHPDVVLFGKQDGVTLDAAAPLDRGFALGGVAASALAATATFASGPRLAAAYALDSPLGRDRAGTVRLFSPPQPSFALPQQLAYAAGGAIAPIAPVEVRRASAMSYAIAPALPAGLALDPASGTISGTPQAASAAATYTVTGSDRLGSVRRSFTLRIDASDYGTLAPDAGATTQSRPVFEWSPASAPDDTEPVTTYSLMVDGRLHGSLPHSACSTTRCELLVPTALPDGRHTWHVETTARDGHVRGTPSAELTVADPPVARLALTRSAIHTGEPLGVDASGSTDPNGTIVRYEFDLDGDGSFETDAGGDPRRTTSFATIGDRTIRVRVTDSGGLTQTAGAAVHVTPAPPAGELGISINDGAIATSDPNVTVSLVWPRLAETALISNDGGFGPAGATRELGLVARIPWTLASSGPERLPKIVYLRFRGGESGRETYTDDIILDQRPPQVVDAELLAPRGAGRAAATSAAPSATAARRGARKPKQRRGGKGRRRPAKQALRIRGRDDNSGLRQVEVARRRGGRPFLTKRLAAADRVGRRSQSVTLRVPTGGTLFVRVTDVAGNLSRWKSVRKAR